MSKQIQSVNVNKVNREFQLVVNFEDGTEFFFAGSAESCLRQFTQMFPSEHDGLLAVRVPSRKAHSMS